MPLSRRGFIAATATSLAFSGFAVRAQETDQESETYRNEIEGYGPLIVDPRRMLDLPSGFAYQVISQAGETMADGFLVPGKADGMGCFDAGDGKVLLVRNHELSVTDFDYGPFGLGGRLAGKSPSPWPMIFTIAACPWAAARQRSSTT